MHMNAEHQILWALMPIFAGLGALVFIIVLTPFAETLRLIDRPNHRKLHNAPVPMVGGVAIYLVILSALLIWNPPDKLAWLMLSVSILVAVGALDDAFGLGVRVRFAAQLLATGIMIAGGGFWLISLGVDVWGIDRSLAWVGISVTVFAVVGLTNAFNMVDGIDGLASGHMLIGLLTVGLTLFAVNGSVHQLEWLVILWSAVFVFWLVNLSLTPLKRVFLGDAGSLLLGFIMAWTLIYYTQEPVALMHPVAALWCVTIPVFDTLVVIPRRIKNNQSPFSPDRNHLHHIFVDMGVCPRHVLILILGVSAALNALGIWITYSLGPIVSLSLYVLALGVFGYGMLHPSVERNLAVKLGLVRDQ